MIDLRREATCSIGIEVRPTSSVLPELARTEGEIVLSKPPARYSAIRPARRADEVPWQLTLLLRGVDSLPVRAD